MTTQWFKDVIPNEETFVRAGIVDEIDPVKRKFYSNKMYNIVKKSGYIVELRESGELPIIDIFIKFTPMIKYTAVIWIHPKGGGDDFIIDAEIIAPNLKGAKNEVKKILKKNNSHVFNDYSISEKK